MMTCGKLEKLRIELFSGGGEIAVFLPEAKG
jgi:hypothetical protein